MKHLASIFESLVLLATLPNGVLVLTLFVFMVMALFVMLVVTTI